MIRKPMLAGALGLVASLSPWLLASTHKSQSAVQPSVQKGNGHKASVRSQQPGSEGERIFEQNCSRCHWAPEGFSPSISGTVVRHMRVRASLSQHDAEELLHFFNP